MAEVEILNANGMTINKVISDDIKKVDGTAYITKEAADELYKPKNNGEVNVKSINYIPAQEQKIQFSLNEPYTIKFAGWFVVNPDDRAAESWYISINDRPMFHSDDDGNMSVSILVYEGDVITSTTEYDRYGYLMPCESELSDWREVKSDADIWAGVVTSDGTVMDQWLDNTRSSNWNATHGSTYKDALSYIKDDQAFDSNGVRLFYVQSENIRTGYHMFYDTALSSFNGDLSSLTEGERMFYKSAIESFNGDLSSLTEGERMFYRSAIASFNGNLSSLTNGGGMFYNTSLASFNGDLSSLTTLNDMFYGCSALESFNGNLSSLTNGYLMFYGCTSLQSFNGNLSNLTDGDHMFQYSALASWNIDLPSLTNGYYMLSNTALTSFSGDLSSLTIGDSMFYNTNLESFNGDLSSLTHGSFMFYGCTSLQSFSSDLSNLTNGYYMFYKTAIESFSGNLSKLTNGYNMFSNTALTSFSSDLSSLTNGAYMFSGCKLNLESVQNIANTIKTVSSGSITIGIQSSLQGNADLNTALTTIGDKGWTVTTQYNS